MDPLLFGIDFLEPARLIGDYGDTFLWISLLIVFVECGLFFPFLPGDTLLFALGLFIAGSEGEQIEVLGTGEPLVELVVAMVLLIVAAFLGNVVGYEIGRKIGPPLYERDGRILKRKYLDNTSAFFERHGNKALVIGRFVPFVRTYITVVAGVTLMQRRRFFVWSFIGAVAWVVSIVVLGYFLGQVELIANNIDYAAIAIALFTLLPIVYEYWKHRGELHHLHGDGPSELAQVTGEAPETVPAAEAPQTDDVAGPAPA